MSLQQWALKMHKLNDKHEQNRSNGTFKCTFADFYLQHLANIASKRQPAAA